MVTFLHDLYFIPDILLLKTIGLLQNIAEFETVYVIDLFIIKLRYLRVLFNSIKRLHFHLFLYLFIRSRRKWIKIPNDLTYYGP